jgi:integrase
MPAKARKIPSYRLHKPTGQAVVRLDGRDHYLGKHGSDESHEKYRRIIAEWLTAGRAKSPAPADSTVPAAGTTTVNDVILAFLTRHAEAHYRRPDGTPTGELGNYRHSLRPLRQLYGRAPASGFGPLNLKAVRRQMIESGLCRTTINQRVGRIVRVFKWAASEELVPAGVYHALKTVAGLPKGRSAAKEPAPVRPVPDDRVDAIRPHVARQVWAMIELQRLTGMRPGEVCIMRTCDLDTSRQPWIYTPNRHKTEHHDKRRCIPIGRKGREVLGAWLRTDMTAYLFQPREAMAEFRAEQRRNRKTPLYPSQRARPRKEEPKYAPGERYTTRTYGHAIGRGCRKAGVSHWHPNQLRHNTATLIRKEFDLDKARAVLGHSDASTTTIYAERDVSLAADVIERIG